MQWGERLQGLCKGHPTCALEARIVLSSHNPNSINQPVTVSLKLYAGLCART